MPKLTIIMTIPVPDLSDLDNPEFYWEEHLCIGDIIEDYILPLIEEADQRKSCICPRVDQIVYQKEEVDGNDVSKRHTYCINIHKSCINYLSK